MYFRFFPVLFVTALLTFSGGLFAQTAEDFYKKGLSEEKAGDYDGAIADCDRALALNPNHAHAYNIRGYCKYRKQDLDGAIADYDRAITLDPNFAYAYANRGNAKKAKGDSEGAKADQARYKELLYSGADIPPQPISQAEPVYPVELRKLGLRGQVMIGFISDVEGRVRDPVVLSSTNPALNQPAIDAVLKWRFKPGTKNGVPVNVRMEVPISFQLDNVHNGGNEPYHVGSDIALPEQIYGIPPKLLNTVFAVYPFELLRDGEQGSAEVRFVVNPGGLVTQATVIMATRPEFGRALIAMLDEWKFQPAMKDGKPTGAPMDIKQKFVPTTLSAMESAMESDPSESWAIDKSDVPVSDSAMELLKELKKEKLVLCPVKELDAKLQLLSPHPPVFPSALIGKATEGQAVVEFLIDHDGNVQLPRIISATDPAFGYAAVQGVSAWKFAPPTSHGKKVAVRAQIPIKFTAPKPATAVAPAQN